MPDTDDILEVYGSYRPTPFDAGGDSMMPDRATWYLVPVSQTRDSGVLARANFAAARASFTTAEGEGWEIHRFGHWGPGWYEIIIVDPTCDAAVKVACDIAAALASYPVLSDDLYSEMEWQHAADTWSAMSLRERAGMWQRARTGASLFSIRAATHPEWADEYLRE